MADVEIPDWLRSLPLAPEYRPTDTEFADPIAFISRIEQEASAFGICKVVPPLPKPSKRFVLSNLNRSLSDSPDAPGAVFTTRCQELGSRRGCPSVHKQVWQSGKFYSLEQFEAKSRAFARTHLGNCKDTHPMEVEAQFWKAAAEKPIYVEYANDVPGSGFYPPEESARRRPYGHRHKGKTRHGRRRKEATSEDDGRVDRVSKDIEGTAGWKLSNSPWNLQVIARSPGSLTRFMPDEVPGVTSPMVYIGMLFSWFAWHVEDHELHSLNFLHTGASKSWYAVPGSYASVLEEVVRIEGYGSHIDHLAAFIMLGEKRTLISPEVLIASGIPCCRLVQNPGEFVVTFPRAYHVGFSHGFNCGEAANFATYKWLNVAKEAAVRRASMNYLPMLSHQQLLYLLAMSFISRVPRELLPGARSSRLRDRIKEERELVVKKSFLEDIIIEHKLLKVLLGRKSTLNVVLWDTDMLPQPSSYSESSPSLSFEQLALDAGEHEEIESQLINEEKPFCFDTNNCSADESRGDENNLQDAANKLCSNNKQKSEYSSDLKGSCSGSLNGSMKSLYDDDSDLPYGLDVDPGALVCVGCGILGYPFMSIIQPSDNAFEALLSIDSKAAGQKPEKLKLPLSSSSKSPMGEIDSGCMDRIIENNLNRTNTLDAEDWTDVDTDAIPSVPVLSRHDSPHKWDLSDQRFRPYIFCLQHAIEVEKKLQCFGGARMLIICHSDYPKIKSQAMSLQDISTLLHCEDFSLEKASKEDLDLINISIDNEKCENIEEDDWTSKMGLNLKHFIKRRKENLDKQESFSLSLDGLIPCLTEQCGLTLRWPARRSRTPCRFMTTSRYRFQPGPFSNNNVNMTNPPCNAIGDALVAKSCEERSMPARAIDLGFSANQLPESDKGNGFAGEIPVTEDSDRNLSGCVAHRKHQIDIVPHLPMSKDKKHGSIIDISTLEGKASCKPELPVQTGPYETFSLLETKEERLYGLQPVTESTIEASNQPINIEFRGCLVDNQNNNPSGEDGQPSLFSSRSCEVQQGLLDGSSADGKSENDIIAGSCNSGLEGKSRNATITRCGNSVLMEDGNENIEAEMKCRTMFNLEETPSKGILTEGGIYGKTSLNDLQTAVGSSCENSAMPQMICSADIFRKVGMDLFPMRSKAVACYHRKRKKSDNIVSSTLCSAGNDIVSTYNDAGNLKVQETPPCIKQQAKRKRELEYLSCIEYNFGNFIRSPCEGLRARSGRSFEMTKNKVTTSLGRKMNSASHLVSRRKGGHGQYVCTLGCCHMRFDTKKELALHKQNCCT